MTLLVVAASAGLGSMPWASGAVVLQEGVSPNESFATPDNGIRNGSQADSSIGGTLDVGTISLRTARSLISFDLSAALKAPGQVAQITLQLTKDRESTNWDNVERTINLYRVAPFVEGEVTWNKSDSTTSWTTPGGDFDSTKPLASVIDTSDDEETLTFATTPEFVAAANDALQNHNGRLYLLMAAPAAENVDPSTNAGFHQAERDAALRPKLTITLVPEPAGAMSMLGIGVLALLGRWRSQ